ncbi:MAG: sulfatase-like hydrolase/transferase [Spirochaetales bacterium]|nr:sulfatase-like hydrolase/transferase [Spirochaetales bacterium]
MADQLRSDFIGSMPNINRIAEGTVFTDCLTSNPVCTPARTALLTGRYSHQIGTLEMSGDLSPQIPTYMQALQKQGYYTAGIGKFHFLQTWSWDTPRGKGIPLKAIREDIKKFGFDYVWETSGKQLMTQNYCDYAAYLDSKNLLED